jgi:methylaspartate ammonia-lyase
MRAAPGLGGYYADDLTAIRAGVEADGFVYRGAPVTAGHAHIRNPAEAIVIRLRSDSGATGWGDAVTVQYAGFGGREPPIDMIALRPELELAGDGLCTAGELSFFEACTLVEGLRRDGRALHSGLRYGLSQALLALAAHTQGCSPAQVLMEGLGEQALAPVAIYAQSGEERRTNVDKMILKDVDVLPHGLINSPAVFGPGGVRFLAYARWVRDRVSELGRDGYVPRLHFDVYGMLGAETGGDVAAMTGFCEALVESCRPYAVQLESPRGRHRGRRLVQHHR